jgi:prepilin-type N-terminal cleavage/methylation domain-containing protein
MFSIAEKNKNKNSSGFTLPEILMVIAIIGILSVISVISFNPIKRSTKLNASVDEVSSALNLAKSYSLQGRMPSGLNSICGYGFKFTSTTQYQIFYYYHYDGMGNLDCSDPNNFTQTAINTQDLETGVTLTSPAPGTTSTIYFSIPRASVVFIPANPNFRLTYPGSEKTVSVSANGLIQ